MQRLEIPQPLKSLLSQPRKMVLTHVSSSPFSTADADYPRKSKPTAK
jgi:hypothetical protein